MEKVSRNMECQESRARKAETRTGQEKDRSHREVREITSKEDEGSQTCSPPFYLLVHGFVERKHNNNRRIGRGRGDKHTQIHSKHTHKCSRRDIRVPQQKHTHNTGKRKVTKQGQ